MVFVTENFREFVDFVRKCVTDMWPGGVAARPENIFRKILRKCLVQEKCSKHHKNVFKRVLSSFGAKNVFRIVFKIFENLSNFSIICEKFGSVSRMCGQAGRPRDWRRGQKIWPEILDLGYLAELKVGTKNKIGPSVPPSSKLDIEILAKMTGMGSNCGKVVPSWLAGWLAGWRAA